jgi:hypothetical protein
MANTAWRYMTLESGPHEWRRAWHLGWIDGQHRARWHAEYERMSRREQIGYEQGRLHVMNVIAAGLPVPVWDGSKSGARNAYDWMRRAAERIGHPVPPEFKKVRVS